MNSTLFCKQLNDLDFLQAANPAAAELVSSMQYSREKKFSVFYFKLPKLAVHFFNTWDYSKDG